MACPTCDHTLACIVVSDMERCFQCTRCGTVTVDRKKTFDGVFQRESVYVPALVTRCRDFEKTLGPGWGKLWVRLGIAESINPPEAREQHDLRVLDKLAERLQSDDIVE